MVKCDFCNKQSTHFYNEHNVCELHYLKQNPKRNASRVLEYMEAFPPHRIKDRIELLTELKKWLSARKIEECLKGCPWYQRLQKAHTSEFRKDFHILPKIERHQFQLRKDGLYYIDEDGFEHKAVRLGICANGVRDLCIAWVGPGAGDNQIKKIADVKVQELVKVMTSYKTPAALYRPPGDYEISMPGRVTKKRWRLFPVIYAFNKWRDNVFTPTRRIRVERDSKLHLFAEYKIAKKATIKLWESELNQLHRKHPIAFMLIEVFLSYLFGKFLSLLGMMFPLSKVKVSVDGSLYTS